ncbi:hypothetical protein [Lyngbya aestuarii]|uniref:hypothetical protein n=1 Tax=Lyngbya aestuarii TaxID=118322 RepID=UPI00403DD592
MSSDQDGRTTRISQLLIIKGLVMGSDQDGRTTRISQLLIIKGLVLLRGLSLLAKGLNPWRV